MLLAAIGCADPVRALSPLWRRRTAKKASASRRLYSSLDRPLSMDRPGSPGEREYTGECAVKGDACDAPLLAVRVVAGRVGAKACRCWWRLVCCCTPSSSVSSVS